MARALNFTGFFNRFQILCITMNDTPRIAPEEPRQKPGGQRKVFSKRAAVLRRAIQGVFLFIFLFGIFAAGAALPPDFFLRFDPLMAVGLPIVSRTFMPELIPGLLVLVVTLALGGVFCGYVCPMGTTIDMARGLLRFVTKPLRRKKNVASYQSELFSDADKIVTRGWLQIKYMFLVAILTVAFLEFNMVVWGAPLALITRFYVLIFEPEARVIAQNGLAFVGSGAVIAQRAYAGGIFLLVAFGVIFALELVKPRFWCRYFCPAGALIGLLTHFAPWRRRVRKCNSCGICAAKCPAEAISPNGLSLAANECIACRTCTDVCPARGVVFSTDKRGELKDESLSEKQADVSAQELPVASAESAGKGYAEDVRTEEEREAGKASARRPRRRFAPEVDEPEAKPEEKESKGGGIKFIFRRSQAKKNIFGISSSSGSSTLKTEEDLLREVKDIGELPQVERPFSLTTPSRRAFIGATAIGALLGFVHFASAKRILSPNSGPRARPLALLRPPGALPEIEFLSRCVRCGLCMRACPTNGLQPAWSSGWVEDIFSPVLTPKSGNCRHDCNACGLVCPTHAIAPLPLAQKQWAKIGTADVVESRCLALSYNQPCIVCYEACPYGAIDLVRVPNVKVPVPMVNAERCYGCGCCEQNCPTRRPAIVVKAAGALRLPAGADYPSEAKARGLDIHPGGKCTDM